MTEERLATLESTTNAPEPATEPPHEGASKNAPAAAPEAQPAPTALGSADEAPATGEDADERVDEKSAGAGAPSDVTPDATVAEAVEEHGANGAATDGAGEETPRETAGDAVAAEPSSSEAAASEASDGQPPPDASQKEPEAGEPEPEPVRALRSAMESEEPIEGKIIGWNNGGFHVVVGGMTAFCPRSEIELDAPKDPKTYLDRDLLFRVLKVQRRGKRIVLSRAAHLKNERRVVRQQVQKDLTPGGVRSGQVASITDFGAFVDLDGVQGLVHISELSRRRVEHPSEVVEVGQEVEVKILRVENDGRRISLSMKALEPDPWEGGAAKLEEGSVVKGTVERVADFGAFIAVAPGLTGLLPTSVMGLPRGASAARMFSPGKEVMVQIQNVDRRRRRISLSLEGSTTEGSRKDFESYRKTQHDSGGGFNALAAALEKIRGDDD